MAHADAFGERFLQGFDGVALRQVRNGGDFGLGLAPRRPMAWHALQFALAIASPRLMLPAANAFCEPSAISAASEKPSTLPIDMNSLRRW